MKAIFLLVPLIFLFTACSEKTVTKQECIEQGKLFKAERKLNFRTGEYETVSFCIEKV